MSTGGWWDAWTALVSVGWVLLVIAVGAFFAGGATVVLVQTLPARRSEHRQRQQDRRRREKQRQREVERQHRDEAMTQDVAAAWPDVLLALRQRGDGRYFRELRNGTPGTVTGGVTLTVALEPDVYRLIGSNIFGQLRARVLEHEIEELTGYKLDVELISAA